jgi:DNA-3-methyladenine glycosylase II
VPGKLTCDLLLDSTRLLAKKDKNLAGVVDKHGPPPLWDREPGFATLVRIILEQQVSLVSARAIYHRLQDALGSLNPEAVLAVGEQGIRSLGVTRQKTAYLVNLARAVEDGSLDIGGLANLDDAEAIGILTSIKGIGPWTAGIYLLMALCRPDAWPPGDIALATAYKNLKGLSQKPTSIELDEIAQAWRPHRATAARILWHYYLSEKQA